MRSRARAVEPPSALARAALAVALLLGFYLVLLAAAAFLFVLPVGLLWHPVQTGHLDVRMLFVVAICWIPASLLVMSVFATRRPPFVPPKRRLQRDEAPGLFAMIDELATTAGTAPPGEVYLEPLPTLAVTEVGSAWRSRRILFLGAPLLHMLTVDDLRVGIAHELGHFFGGDTRLTTIAVQTYALFDSVITSTERDPFRVGTRHAAIEGGLWVAEAIGRGLVDGYGRIFLRLTRPMRRKQELAADALSASLLGGRAAARALEKVAIGMPLYRQYLTDDVAYAVSRGAMPTDLSAGFERMRANVLATQGGRDFVDHVRARETHAYDSHPALADRVRALEGVPDVEGPRDERPATTLFADPAALDAWLVEATRERLIAAAVADVRQVPIIREMPWESIPVQVYAPAAREAARRAAERLHSLFPDATTLGAIFVATWRGLESGKTVPIVLRLHPGLAHMEPHEADRTALGLCQEVLLTLLQGALLERGATIEDTLGAPLALRLGEDRVVPAELLALLATDGAAARAAFDYWARRVT